MWLNLNLDWLVTACFEVTCVWLPGHTNEKPPQVRSGSPLTLFGILSNGAGCVRGWHRLGLAQREDLSASSGWCHQQAGQAVSPSPAQLCTTPHMTTLNNCVLTHNLPCAHHRLCCVSLCWKLTSHSWQGQFKNDILGQQLLTLQGLDRFFKEKQKSWTLLPLL